MEKWLIWSNEHQGWWKSEGSGYANDMKLAGLYPYDEAKKICERANRCRRTPNEMMVPYVETQRVFRTKEMVSCSPCGLISLTRLIGMDILDIRGYVTMKCDGPVFAITGCLLENGTTLYLGGESCTYFISKDKDLNLDNEQLSLLCDDFGCDE